MTPLCQHMMPTGKTCQSPALTAQPLCFHHDRETTQMLFILTLPALTDRSAILLALSQVVVAMGLSQIGTARANLLLRSLNLATRLISAIEKEAKIAQKQAAVVTPKPQVAVVAAEEPGPIQASAEHRSPKPQHQPNPNDRLPRSFRQKMEALQRAHRSGNAIATAS
jgi:hypothetical protein